MRNLALINPEHVSEQETATYATREAARAIVFDADRRVALLHVSKKGYYKLPGGGIEAGEDPISALKRECKEEIGCDIEVTGEVGSVVEYRKQLNLKQTSYCYLAKVVGEKISPDFTELEKEQGFEVVWMPYEEAKRAPRESTPQSYEGAYIIARDALLLDSIPV